MNKKYSLDCDPICGFHLETHNEKEAIRMGMEHLADAHPTLNVTTKELKNKIKTM